MKPRKQCGTPSGYQAHRRANEPACDPCLRIYAARMKAWRHRTGRNTRTLVPDNIAANHGRPAP